MRRIGPLILALLPLVSAGAEGPTKTWQVQKPGESLTVQARQDDRGFWLFPLALTARFLGYEDEVCSRCGHDEIFATASAPPLAGGRLLVPWFQDSVHFSGSPGIHRLPAANQRVDDETWVSSQVLGYLCGVQEDTSGRVLTLAPGEAEGAQARKVTLLLVPAVVAGLLDGINPCVFTTLVFLVSYLAVARRSRQQILVIGSVYTLSVFLTYFFVGLGLFQVVRAAEAFPWLSAAFRALVVASLVVLAILGFRDAILAHRGRGKDSILKLPSFLQNRVRSAIRSRVRSPMLLVAAASLGFLVTVLELVCTGQVYFPMISYALRVERDLSALGFLLVYNLAFIAPLAVVFLLTWLGTGSAALAAWYRKSLALAKGMTALLFALLAAFLVLQETGLFASLRWS